MTEDERKLLLEVAMRVDVSVYNPQMTYYGNKGHSANVDDLAEYIAHIRIIEAKAVIDAINELEETKEKE